MVLTYTENPVHFREIESFIEKDMNGIKQVFFSAKRIVFYDACSLQRHSHLADKERNILIGYFTEHETAIFITRCILMELASNRHMLAQEYIKLMKGLNDAGG